MADIPVTKKSGMPPWIWAVIAVIIVVTAGWFVLDARAPETSSEIPEEGSAASLPSE